MPKKHNNNKLYTKADFYDLIASFYFKLLQRTAEPKEDYIYISRYKYIFNLDSKESINFVIKQLIISIGYEDFCRIFNIKDKYFREKISEIKHYLSCH